MNTASQLNPAEAIFDNLATRKPAIYGVWTWTDARYLCSQWALPYRVANLPGASAIAEGCCFADDSNADAPFTEELRALNVNGALSRLALHARIDGMAALVILTDRPVAESWEPGEKVYSLEVYPRDRITIEAYSLTGEPRRVSIIKDGAPTYVHPSRVFIYRPMVNALNPSDPVSPIAALRSEFVSLDVQATAANRTALRLGALVVSREGTTEANDPTDISGDTLDPVTLETAERERLASLNRTGGNAAMILREGETATTLSVRVTGYDELARAARANLSAASGIPATLLFEGDASPSLNNGGKSGASGWAQALREIRREVFEPILYRIGELLYSGAYPDPATRPRWSVKWNPSWLDTESNAIRAQNEELALKAYKDRAVTADELRAGFYLPGSPGRLVIAQSVTESAASRTDAEEGPRMRVPAGAREAARKVLRWKEEHRDEIRGMTSEGWARARQLASEEFIPWSDAVAINAWFARHGAQPATRAIANPAKPWTDAGWTSWEGWGGDVMRSAVRDHVEGWREKSAQRADSAPVTGWVGLPVSPSAFEALSALLPSLDAAATVEDDPHLTLCYLGTVGAQAFRDVRDRLAQIAHRWSPQPLRVIGLDVFTGAGEGGAAIVALIDPVDWLERAERDVGRSLARLVAVDPAGLDFRPHVTIGWVDRPAPGLAAAVRARPILASLPAPDVVEGRVGARVARFPIGRR